MVWVMDERFYYSTGKAAQELGASQDTIRALCNSGAIRAVPTNGRQWRIPAREIERLKREGLPPVPRPMPGDSPMTRNVSTRHRLNGDHDDDADPHRAAGREPEVVQAYAGAARKHALIEEREADWRLQELEDRFRQREDEIQTRQRKRESEAQRADWLREWEQVALSAFDQHAPGAPPQMRLDLHKEIRERLGSLNPIPTPQVTAELIAGIVKPLVDRQREQEEADRIIAEALDSGLPPGARADWRGGEPSLWQVKLHETIASRLNGYHPLDTLRRVVNQAIRDVTSEFERHEADRKADTTDAELRRSVIDELTQPLRGRLSDDDWADMQEAIEARFGQLALGTRRSKLDAACREAMAPWRQAVDQSDAELRRLRNEVRQKRDADEAVRRDRQMREDLLGWSWWYISLPSSLAQAERDRLIAAARRKMDELPLGTGRAELEQARDAIIGPAVQAHERRKAAESRVNALLLDAIETAVAKEERDGLELDGPLDRVNFKFEVRDAIRGPLVDWLSRINGLTDDQLRLEIERRARRCARELVSER